jgi:hypothetical protein
LPAACQTPNLEDQWLERSNSRHKVSPASETMRANPSSGRWNYGREIAENFAESGDFHVGVLLHAVNLRHGTDGFTSPPKKGALRIFSPEKSDNFGRVRTRELGYQRPARSPLDHRSRWHRILPLNILQQKSVSMMWVFLKLAANSVNIINEGDKCYILCRWSCYEDDKDWTSFSSFGFLLFVDRITKLPLSLCKESAVVFSLSVMSINRTVCQDTVSIFS